MPPPYAAQTRVGLDTQGTLQLRREHRSNGDLRRTDALMYGGHLFRKPREMSRQQCSVIPAYRIGVVGYSPAAARFVPPLPSWTQERGNAAAPVGGWNADNSPIAPTMWSDFTSSGSSKKVTSTSIDAVAFIVTCHRESHPGSILFMARDHDANACGKNIKAAAGSASHDLITDGKAPAWCRGWRRGGPGHRDHWSLPAQRAAWR